MSAIGLGRNVILVVKKIGIYVKLPHVSKATIRVFPKVDHSANIARIVLVEYTIGSVVELNFC